MKGKINRYILIGGFIALLIVAAYIIKPYLVAILTSAVIAYIFYPVFKWLNKKINNKFASAIIVTLIILLMILVPLALSANVVTKEAYLIYLSGKTRLGGDILQGCDNYICNFIKDWSSDIQVQYYFQEALQTSINYVLDGVSKLVLGIPKLVINLFISVFVIFYLLKDGDIFVKKAKQIFKLHEREHKTITRRLDDVMHAVIYGNIIVALIQGAVGALSFWFFGVSSPLLWGVIMAVLSFAPYVGTAMIWIPASLFFIFDGVSNNETLLIWKGLGIALVNLVAGGAADNILKPKIIGKRSSVHPALILIGIFGGISLFGIAGFIIGPVVLALTGTLIDLYITNRG
jgi:predicted PurR-regulated permease PerM